MRNTAQHCATVRVCDGILCRMYEYLAPDEVATLLHLTPRELERLTREDVIPHIALPTGDVLYIRSDIDAWVASLRRPQPEVAGA